MTYLPRYLPTYLGYYHFFRYVITRLPLGTSSTRHPLLYNERSLGCLPYTFEDFQPPTCRLVRSPLGDLLHCIYSLSYYNFGGFQPSTCSFELLPPPLFAMDEPSSSNSKKRQRQNSSASNTNADDPFPPPRLEAIQLHTQIEGHGSN